MNDYQTWGERLFPPPIKGKVAKSVGMRGSKGRTKTKATNQSILSAEQRSRRVQTLVKKLVKKAPEVMVKITGSSKSTAKISAHLDYISRNGEVELETEDGMILSDKESIRTIMDEWADAGDIPKHENQSSRREAFNIVLSMPANTDRDSVKSAARAFAQQAFEGHEWFMAEHRDEAHPHVHFCVKASNNLGHRLNPRKADLQQWRETFAEKLQEYGVEANATRRQVRGKTYRSKTQAQYHSDKRKQPLNYEQVRRKQVIREIKSGLKTPEHPSLLKAKATRQEVIASMAYFAKAWSQHGDKKLARDLIQFAQQLPPVRSKHESRVIAVHERLLATAGHKNAEKENQGNKIISPNKTADR